MLCYSLLYSKVIQLRVCVCVLFFIFHAALDQTLSCLSLSRTPLCGHALMCARLCPPRTVGVVPVFGFCE